MDPATLERIRHASDIVDVVGSYLPLKKAGAHFVSLCPFHREKTPSFNVNPRLQIFHCFGCHKGGDVFTFVQTYENIGFMEAVQRLADRAGIVVEKDETRGAARARHLKETLLEMHEKLTQRWQQVLLNDASGEPARQYLAKRGLNQEAVQRFRLGYAPDVWDDTVNWVRGKEYELETAEKGGLITRKENSDHFYDRFKGRLIFPICDELGRVIGFSGRILDDEAKAAKYLNSPESPLFSKRRVFFGLDKAKRPMLDRQQVVVCEGQVDLITCHMAGLENVVAPQGTAFTADHARILRRYVPEVVLCFDSDTAGKNAVLGAWEGCLQAGLAVRVATVPAPHDPDSYVREHGVEALEDLIGRASEFFDYFVEELFQENDARTDRGRMQVLRQLGEMLHKASNEVLLETYAQKTALRLGVSPEAVRSEFRKMRGRGSSPSARAGGVEEQSEQEELPRPSPPEFWLMRLLLSDDIDMKWVQERLDLAWVRHPVVRRVAELRLASSIDGSWHGAGGVLSTLEEPSWKALISEAAFEPRPVLNPDEFLKGIPGKPGVVQRLRDAYIDQKLSEVNAKLSEPNLSDELSLSLLGQREALRREKFSSLD